MSPASAPTSTTEFRVRSYELDFMGHVNNAAYLNWLEQARIGAFEELGWSLQGLLERRWITNVVRIEIDYRRPLFFGDRVRVTTELEGIGRSSLTLRHRIEASGEADGPAAGADATAGGRDRTEASGAGVTGGPGERRIAADARVVVVWLGDDGRPTPVPDDLRRALGTPVDDGGAGGPTGPRPAPAGSAAADGGRVRGRDESGDEGE